VERLLELEHRKVRRLNHNFQIHRVAAEPLGGKLAGEQRRCALAHVKCAALVGAGPGLERNVVLLWLGSTVGERQRHSILLKADVPRAVGNPDQVAGAQPAQTTVTHLDRARLGLAQHIAVAGVKAKYGVAGPRHFDHNAI
jgi:hypothetical protein